MKLRRWSWRELKQFSMNRYVVRQFFKLLLFRLLLQLSQTEQKNFYLCKIRTVDWIFYKPCYNSSFEMWTRLWQCICISKHLHLKMQVIQALEKYFLYSWVLSFVTIRVVTLSKVSVFTQCSCYSIAPLKTLNLIINFFENYRSHWNRHHERHEHSCFRSFGKGMGNQKLCIDWHENRIRCTRERFVCLNIFFLISNRKYKFLNCRWNCGSRCYWFWFVETMAIWRQAFDEG